MAANGVGTRIDEEVETVEFIGEVVEEKALWLRVWLLHVVDVELREIAGHDSARMAREREVGTRDADEPSALRQSRDVPTIAATAIALAAAVDGEGGEGKQKRQTSENLATNRLQIRRAARTASAAHSVMPTKANARIRQA